MHLLTPAQCFITPQFYYINHKRKFNKKTPCFYRNKNYVFHDYYRPFEVIKLFHPVVEDDV